VYETYGPRTEIRLYRLLASTSMIVGVIDAVLAGVFGGLLAKAAGAGSVLSFFIGGVVSSVIFVLLVYETRRIEERVRDALQASFPR
jgi:Na+/melibiose symporter-like transporter